MRWNENNVSLASQKKHVPSSRNLRSKYPGSRPRVRVRGDVESEGIAPCDDRFYPLRHCEEVKPTRQSKTFKLLSWLVMVFFCGTTAFAGMQQPVRSHHPMRMHQQSVSLRSGSLRHNLSRIAKLYGWKKLVWLPSSDYQWVGRVTIREHDVYALFTRVLQEYPLQAVFYKGNHVLVIRPRNK